MTFNPLADCLDQLTQPRNVSFLGDVQFLQTGDVLQVWHCLRSR